jgi:hypothetical protein
MGLAATEQPAQIAGIERRAAILDADIATVEITGKPKFTVIG